ncbi:hypothetical protein R1sor_017820 [Riccia sorocarpa]|uniref:Stress up-regulated Nod 19 n=1 Tax=Riccia sorocarpa TaxID=122646 RepID=A0ABD3I807_9MARC
MGKPGVSRSFLLVVWCMVCVVAVSGEIKTFRSPAFTLGPGDVENNYFWMELPPGHIGIKSFNGEVVDEDGHPVPLSEVYLHHWVAVRAYVDNKPTDISSTDVSSARNAGICQSEVLPQFFGFGSETRRTDYHIPEPYVIETGNPEEIPEGYKEQWILNVHAIDTRGTVNPRHCVECLCAAYNVSVTEYGSKVPEEYVGGLGCCLHHYRCALKEGVHGTKRNLYLQYTVEYVPMEPSLRPVRLYIIDITDDRKSVEETPRCKVEYDVLPCDRSKDIVCRDEKHALAWLPEENVVDVIYVVGHLHGAGVSIALHGQDGREICTSYAMYGTGNEAGNEKGYVVGLGSCYPEIGSQKIKPGEKLHIKSVYKSDELHTGVMGLVGILVADPVAEHHRSSSYWKITAAVVTVAVAVVVIGISLSRYAHSKRSNMGYQSVDQP